MADLKISALTASTTPLAGTEVLPIVQGGATVKVSVANLTAGRAIATGAVTASTGAANTLLLTNADTFTGYNCVSLNGTKTFAGGMGFVGGDGGDPILYHIAPAGGEHSFRIANTVYGGINTTGLFTSGNVVIQTSGKGIDFSATPGTGTSELLADYEEGTWTPVPTSGAGSITSYTSSGRYTKTGRVVVISGEITITNGGTASGLMTISGLPFTSFAGQSQPGIAYDPNITGTSVCVFVNSGATSAVVRQFTGAAPLYTNGIGYQFVVTYQV